MTKVPNPDEAEFVRRIPDEPIQSVEPGRHAARRSAMTILYQIDVLDDFDIDAAIQSFNDSEDNRPISQYGIELVKGVSSSYAEIDSDIEANLQDWSVERLGAVERAILRIALYELKGNDIAAAIVVDEAVQLAKRYASQDAGKLINGVLGGWIRDKERDVEQ